MKTFKKIVCSLLIVVMCLTAAPLDGFVGMEWPELPEINMGKIKLPELDFGEWFAGKASATDGLAATGQCGENVYWNYDSKSGKLTINGTGDMYDELWSSPFEDSPIKSVIISDGVTSIGDYAFYYCVDLLSVSIPKSVTYIGESAFSNCTNLASINVDTNNTKYSSDSRGVLFDKNKTVLIKYPSGNTNTTYNIPGSVTIICDSAFYDCEYLKTITIPNGVTSIGAYAFYNCIGITNMPIPASLTAIGGSAFGHCFSLTGIIVDDNNDVFSSDDRGVLFNKNKTCIIQYPIGNSNTSYMIPESVTAIEREAFKYCYGLIDVAIGANVTVIGYEAFYNCINLTSISFPDSITTIEGWAFYGCDSLASVTIPDSVTSIDVAAFNDTEYYNDDKNWENEMLYINEYLIEARSSLSGSCVIKVGTKLIANGAFYGCTNLTSVIMPYGVTTIGDSAFDFCENLTSIYIPESVIVIGDEAFHNCESLASVSIPNSVTTIGDFAFGGCSSLTSVTIPKSVTSIGDSLFEDCGKLKTITVDANNPVYSSDSRGVLFDKNKTILIQYPIGNENYLYKIPDTVTTIGSYAFFLCSYLTNITIPDSVITIGDYAFDNCVFTSITIPDSVTTIGEYAFAYCYNLTRVRIPSSVTSIGWNAFGHCRSLTSITVDAENPSYASDSRGVLYDKNKTILIQYPFGSTYRSYEIPYSVKAIGDEAFDIYESDYFTHIYYSGTVVDWSKIKVGYNNHFLRNLYIKCNYDGSSYIVKAGSCGENVTYVLYSNGDLVISGTGPMYDYGEGDDPSYWFPPYTDYYYDEFDEYGESSGDFIIKKVVIKEGVTTIGNYAFQACRNLEEVEISNTVTSIGTVAFDFCTSLKHIKIPGSVKVIGEEAFSESALETIEIENGLERIEMLAFFYCQSLKKVALPESVEYIGDFAFIICDKLETLIINNKDCEIGLEILVTGEMDEDGNLVEDENGNPIPTECPTVLKGHSGSTAEEYAKTWTDAGYPIKFEVISHKFVEQTIFSATCTENGYTLMECSECGHEIKDNIVEPLGHDYTEKINDNAHCVSKATYDKGSIYYYDCSRCNSIGENTYELNDKLIRVSSVSLNKESITLKKGSKSTLTATVSPSNAADKKVSWSSSNTKVATVDSNGVVTAKGDGTVTITVKTNNGNKTDTCKVTVKDPVTSVSIESAVKIGVGSSYKMSAIINPSNATNKRVSWVSSNTKVAKIDKNGLITAAAEGKATITVTTEDGNKKDTCTVTVINSPLKLTITPNCSSINYINGIPYYDSGSPVHQINVNIKINNVSDATVEKIYMQPDINEHLFSADNIETLNKSISSLKKGESFEYNISITPIYMHNFNVNSPEIVMLSLDMYWDNSYNPSNNSCSDENKHLNIESIIRYEMPFNSDDDKFCFLNEPSYFVKKSESNKYLISKSTLKKIPMSYYLDILIDSGFEWKGSCFGMSALIANFKKGGIKTSFFGGNTAYELKEPINNIPLRDAINVVQCAQNTLPLIGTTKLNLKSEKTLINELYNALHEIVNGGMLPVVGLSTGGLFPAKHMVVAYSIIVNKDYYLVHIYDPDCRYPQKLKLKKDLSGLYEDYDDYSKISCVITDLSLININTYVPGFSQKNSSTVFSGRSTNSNDELNNYTTINVQDFQEITITNSKNNSIILNYEEETITGDLEATVDSLFGGGDNPIIQVMIEEGDVPESYTISCSTGCTLSIENEGIIGQIRLDGSEEAIIDYSPTGFIGLEKDGDSDFDITLYSKEMVGDIYKVALSGDEATNTSIEFNDRGYIVSSNDLGDDDISIEHYNDGLSEEVIKNVGEIDENNILITTDDKNNTEVYVNSDDNDNFEVKKDAHIYNVEVVSATCTEEGYTKLTCKCCGEESVEYFSMLEHIFSDAFIENETPALCEQDGTYDIVVKCLECEKEISRETVIVEAYGHIPSDLIKENIVEATYGQMGSYDKVKYCCLCDVELSREVITIDPISHNHDYSVVTEKEPTCIEVGIEKHICSLCGYFEIVDVLATGHNFADGQSKCSNCDYNKADSCGCKCHKTGLFAKIIWKITIFFNKLLRKNKVCSCGVYHY